MLCKWHSNFKTVLPHHDCESAVQKHCLGLPHRRRDVFRNKSECIAPEFRTKCFSVLRSKFGHGLNGKKAHWKVNAVPSDSDSEPVKTTPGRRGRRKKSEITPTENAPSNSDSESETVEDTLGIAKSSPVASSEGTSSSEAPEPKPPKSSSRSKKSSSKTVKEDAAGVGNSTLDPVREPPKKTPRPLVLCLGEIIYEFVPMVRVSPDQQDHSRISTWKGLQWTPPEFARAPSGSAMNMAVSLARYNVRAGMVGRVGRDAHGVSMTMLMKRNGVKTRYIVFVDKHQTCATSVRFEHDETGKLTMVPGTPSADMTFCEQDIDSALIRKAFLIHFSSLSLLLPTTRAAIFKAIEIAQKSNTLVFFDPNLPLPLWKSRETALRSISDSWINADVIEVTVQELEFLLDEQYYDRRRKTGIRFVSDSLEELKQERDEYHYLPEELEFLWHERLKLLLVTDGTWRIHYYTPDFHGSVAGTEDVLVSAFTCDRTGSGDTIVAGVIKKLVSHPDILKDQIRLEKALRFAIAGGIISQWTIGAIRGFPTESAAQNMVETVFPPSLV